jgi:alpha-D-ribose 1-methylphosphonate 5-triphosphate diphosphatase
MLILTNAKIVAPEEVFAGTLVAEDGRISRIDRGGTSVTGAIDCEGDYLIPGLIDLHTDALERHHTPRTGVRWPMPAAISAHDAQVVASGVTTVFDALAVGAGGEDASPRSRLRECVAELAGRNPDSLRADHFLHLRLELPCPTLAGAYEELADLPQVRLVSVMDHTPGQGQFADIERYRDRNNFGETEVELEQRIQRRRALRELHAESNRERVTRMACERGVPLASHDDRTEEEVARGAMLGVTISEFPVTLEAAGAAKQRGMWVVMGGPNLVLGGSHSGNAAAGDVAAHGWLDCLTSDYVPSSMLHGAFLLAESHGFPLPDAIATVTRKPAEMVGLVDRGSLQPGLRADLVRVRSDSGLPRAVTVWREGIRVF